MTQMSDSESLDVESLCSFIGETRVKATIATDDESEIVVGDVAVVTVRRFRALDQAGSTLAYHGILLLLGVYSNNDMLNYKYLCNNNMVNCFQ